MAFDNESYTEFLRERREAILAKLARAAAKSGRDASEIGLLAVSKTVEPEAVLCAWQAGYTAFAENRPQELNRKLAFVAEHPQMAEARFDLIGNLQKNKINQVIGKCCLIHSISSPELARQVSERAERAGLCVDVLLETNVSGEQSKSGFSPDELRAALDDVCELGGIRVRGLMTMAPKADPDCARRTFCGLRELRDELSSRMGMSLETLSCGMSDDFDIAVEEGSTLVRLGRTVFSPEYDLGD